MVEAAQDDTPPSSEAQRGRSSLLSVPQAIDWLVTRKIPEPVAALHDALKSGDVKASHMNGSERRELAPAEWHDYALVARRPYFAGEGEVLTVEVISVHAFPFGDLYCGHGEQAGYALPNGEPGWRRILRGVCMAAADVRRLWPEAAKPGVLKKELHAFLAPYVAQYERGAPELTEGKLWAAARQGLPDHTVSRQKVRTWISKHMPADKKVLPGKPRRR
jgi:hypothetical protein